MMRRNPRIKIIADVFGVIMEINSIAPDIRIGQLMFLFHDFMTKIHKDDDIFYIDDVELLSRFYEFRDGIGRIKEYHEKNNANREA